MFKKMLVTAAVAILLLVGCTPVVENVKPEDAQKLVDSFKYFKSKHGLCFGVVEVSRMDSGLRLAINQTVVYVSCKEVGL
jgi:uncharacterized lipoprotein NlpE involved in copper resistance